MALTDEVERTEPLTFPDAVTLDELCAISGLAPQTLKKSKLKLEERDGVLVVTQTAVADYVPTAKRMLPQRRIVLRSYAEIPELVDIADVAGVFPTAAARLYLHRELGLDASALNELLNDEPFFEDEDFGPGYVASVIYGPVIDFLRNELTKTRESLATAGQKGDNQAESLRTRVAELEAELKAKPKEVVKTDDKKVRRLEEELSKLKKTYETETSEYQAEIDDLTKLIEELRRNGNGSRDHDIPGTRSLNPNFGNDWIAIDEIALVTGPAGYIKIKQAGGLKVQKKGERSYVSQQGLGAILFEVQMPAEDRSRLLDLCRNKDIGSLGEIPAPNETVLSAGETILYLNRLKGLPRSEILEVMEAAPSHPYEGDRKSYRPNELRKALSET